MLLCHLLLDLLLLNLGPRTSADSMFYARRVFPTPSQDRALCTGSSALSRSALTRRAVAAWLEGCTLVAAVACSRKGVDRLAPTGVTLQCPALLQGDPQDAEELNPLARCSHKSFPAQIF